MGSEDVSVFEIYAHEYDLITSAAQREKYHSREIRSMIDRFAPETVLDAGCATGLSAMLFARAGVKAVGLDRSRRMLKEARKKYAEAGLPLKFRQGSFESLPKNLYDRFDLVVCLANSISGLDTLPKLGRAMRNFFRVLKPGGAAVIQALNYTSVTENALLPIKATQHDGVVWARYARRQGSRYAVHITRLDLNVDPPGFEPFCHEFDNFSPAEARGSMEKAGFKRIVRYADLYLDKKFTRSSRDLVLVGYRPK